MHFEDLSFFQEPEFRQSLVKYEKMKRDGNTGYFEADELTDIAEYYMVHDNEQEANEAISLALQMHPRSTDPEVFLARQQMFKGNIEEALRICDNIIEQGDREVFFLRTELLFNQGKNKEAISDMWQKYQTSLDDDPVLLLHDCINLCNDYGQYKQSLEWANILYEKYPSYRKRELIVGECLYYNGRYKDSIGYLEAELESSPYNSFAWTILSESYYYNEQPEDALEAIDFALAITPDDAKLLYNRINCLCYLSMFEEAQKASDELMKSNHTDTEILFQRFLIEYYLERYETALQIIKDFNQETGWQYNQSLPYQAHCYMMLGNAQQFLSTLQIACQVSPETTKEVFKDTFPDANVEEYYKLASKKINLLINNNYGKG